MLDQVIYTRCMPHRELKRRGEVSRGDGFGVFSMSPAVVDGSRKLDFDYLQSRLASTNAAKEDSPVGLIHSYEYLALSDTDWVLTYEYAREHCLTPRKNGKTHRKGTYIKQSLIGQLQGYPFEFFGASCWNAHLKSENDYYLDDPPNAEPAWLPQVSAAPQGGDMTMDRIRNFVRDGRAEAVKGALWFLLREFGKPESERKVLLIRDVPANVELWIAAMEYAFSAPLARQISFTTNKSRLANQTDTALFYYTDSSGRFYAIRNTQFPVQRRPYCMIVGYHPDDRLSNLRQLPASNFVILDGTTKVLDIPADAPIHAPYFQAAVQYDADIEDFCTILLPSLPLKTITPELPALFDAYKYLLDSQHRADKWSYADTLSHLNQLTRWGLATNEVLNQYLLDECLQAYPRFADRDAADKYPLLQLLWKLAAVLKREDDVRSCITDRLAGYLGSLRTESEHLRSTWQSLSDSGVLEQLRPALLELFADRELPGYSHQFSGVSLQTISTVLQMYLSVVVDGADDLLRYPERLQFFVNALAGMIHDRRETMTLLKKLSRNPELFSVLAVHVSARLEKTGPDCVAQWWEIITDASGGNVANLCRQLARQSKANIDLVEKLLTRQIISAQQCSRDVETVFVEAVNAQEGSTKAGQAFFFAWIQAARLEDAPRIISAARRAALSEATARAIFTRLDNSLPYTVIKPSYAQCISAMESWSQAIGIPSRKTALAELYQAFCYGHLTVDQAIDRAGAFAASHYPISDGFYTSGLFQKLVAAADKFRDPDLTYRMLDLFRFPDKQTHQDYVDRYVGYSLNAVPGYVLAEHMLFLTNLAFLPSEESDRTGKRLPVQIYLENALRQQLPDYARGSTAERIRRMENYPLPVREMLLKMLRMDNLRASSNPLDDLLGGFGSFFRRK